METESPRVIPPEEFCRRAAGLSSLVKLKLSPEEIGEALGAISNLLLELCLILDKPGIAIKTSATFDSKLLPQRMLVRELRSSLGVDFDAARDVLGAIGGTVGAYFKQYEIRDFGRPIALSPLGILQASVSREQTLYLLKYEDPAAATYNKFLVGHELKQQKLEKPWIRIDIPFLLRQIVNTLRPLAERREQTLEVDIDRIMSFSSTRSTEFPACLRDVIANVLVATPNGHSIRIQGQLAAKQVVVIRLASTDLDPGPLGRTLLGEAIDDVNAGVTLDMEQFRSSRVELVLAHQAGGGDIVELFIPIV